MDSLAWEVQVITAWYLIFFRLKLSFKLGSIVWTFSSNDFWKNLRASTISCFWLQRKNNDFWWNSDIWSNTSHLLHAIFGLKTHKLVKPKIEIFVGFSFFCAYYMALICFLSLCHLWWSLSPASCLLTLALYTLKTSQTWLCCTLFFLTCPPPTAPKYRQWFSAATGSFLCRNGFLPEVLVCFGKYI